MFTYLFWEIHHSHVGFPEASPTTISPQRPKRHPHRHVGAASPVQTPYLWSLQPAWLEKKPTEIDLFNGKVFGKMDVFKLFNGKIIYKCRRDLGKSSKNGGFTSGMFDYPSGYSLVICYQSPWKMVVFKENR